MYAISISPGVHQKQTDLKAIPPAAVGYDPKPAIYVLLVEPTRIRIKHRVITVWIKRTDVIEWGQAGYDWVDYPTAKVERIAIHPDDWNHITMYEGPYCENP